MAKPGPKPRPIMDRILAKLNKNAPGGCWTWTGAKCRGGYGHGGQAQPRAMVKVHRVVWEHLRGPIPEGLQLDHLCKVTACANPEHLEPVTPEENLRREVDRAPVRKCGHPRIVGQPCRPCVNAYMRRYTRARRASAKSD